jgi:hypothetical protein
MVISDRGKRKRVGYVEFPEDGEAKQDDCNALKVCLGGSVPATGKLGVEHSIRQPCRTSPSFSARLEFHCVDLRMVVKDLSMGLFLVT